MTTKPVKGFRRLHDLPGNPDEECNTMPTYEQVNGLPDPLEENEGDHDEADEKSTGTS